MSFCKSLRLLTLTKVLKKQPVKIPKTQFYSSIIDYTLNSTLNHLSNRFEFNGVKIENALLARQFINTLTINERVVIKEELIKAEQETQINGKINHFYYFLMFVKFKKDSKFIQSPSWKQIFVVCFQNGLPFIGFGFVDNFVMIVAVNYHRGINLFTYFLFLKGRYDRKLHRYVFTNFNYGSRRPRKCFF